MLPPRTIRPRNLRQGVYRGGLRPIDIYWRIMNGIEGHADARAGDQRSQAGGSAGSQEAESGRIWDMVNYVQSLPYEPISNPIETLIAKRERMCREQRTRR